MAKAASPDQLLLELEELRARLYEAEETLRAISANEVDALVIDAAEGQRVFTLRGAEQPYRTFMEEMNEGAATITADGTILYCNGRLAEMLKTPLNKIIGSSLAGFVVTAKRQPVLKMLEACGVEGCKGEFTLCASDGGEMAVSFAARPLMRDDVTAFGLVITDLTDQKEAQRALQVEINERKKIQKRLEKARDELEQRVAERTAELTQANATLQSEIAERKRAEDQLRRSRDELEMRVQERTTDLRESEEIARKRLAEIEAYYDTAPVGLVILDENLRYLRINERLAELNGVPAAEHIGRTPREIVPWLADEIEQLARQVFESGEPVTNIEFKGETPAKPGIERTWLEGWYPLKNAAGQVVGTTVVVQEVTEQRQLEEQFRQTQKMEAIGTLAGGIAHDFNNILAAIIGFTEMVLDDVSDNPHVQQKMARVLKAGLRGRDLVKQILAFSRKTEGARIRISLAPLVHETHALLRSSLPTTIQMSLAITTNDDHVLADPIQMQQVLMNLATNAAYAMRENGGLLTMEISSATFSNGSLPDPGMEPGTYVKLTVQDTGTGMTEEVQQRIFEPFFTTKGSGQGTGLGLAVVYGIVKNHGGAVKVQSEAGQGSVFEVFLPHAQRPEAKKEETTTRELPTGSERILFVDDEEILVDMARGMLESLGYDVTVATNGTDAWNLFLKDPSRFDLVITDQTMPDVTGLVLAQKMLRVRNMPIILSTGYSETVSAEKANEAGIRAFVMKPMMKKELAETIRRVLDVRTD
jgi:PAS domain S-box-containing protein